MNEEDITNLIQEQIGQNATENQFAVSTTPYHTHNGSDSPNLSYPNLKNRSRFILYRIVGQTTADAVANTVGGNLVMPFGGNFTSVGFTVDTAGTTGTMVVDFLLNGTTILSTQSIILASGSTTTRNNVPQTFKINSFNIGDIMTFDVTSVHTTPAMGLTVFLRVNETTP